MPSLMADFRRERIDVSHGTIQQYSIAVEQFSRWAGREPPLDRGTSDLLREFLRDLSQRRSARTVNNKRQALLTLWAWAYDSRRTDCPPPRIPKFREAKRAPTAWTVEQVGTLLAACRTAREIRWNDEVWTATHWRALVLVIYDTSLRIGCLLRVRRDCLVDGYLTVPGEIQKHGNDTRHRLHVQTLGEIEKLTPHDLLFPWPIRRRQLWAEYHEIVKAAGLPHGRRDKFHRLRRTSYSYVVKALDVQAATDHAGHSRDLSECYLDKSILGRPDPVDLIPRPA